MKQPAFLLTAALVSALFAAFSVPAAGALEIESYRFTDRLLAITAPAAPDVFDGAVIFTASAQRRVGVSFAHEGYGKVHWFKKLVSPQTAARSENVLVYVYEYPLGLRELKYRLIVDGLWTSDPWNPPSRMDGGTGLSYSVVSLPPSAGQELSPDDAGVLTFSYETAPGESVSVAGSFNNWDPFMYEMREESPGRYVLTLSLPPGTYRYVFYHRGERVLDKRNPRKVFASDNTVASEVTVGAAAASRK